MSEACARCGNDVWRPAIEPGRKRALTAATEVAVVVSAIAAIAWSPWLIAAVVLSGVATLVVVLRGRQELCASCGWARAVRSADPPRTRPPDPPT